MHEKKELSQAAYQLAEEIRDGMWSHVADLKIKPTPDCSEIIDELRRRCPDYTVEKYKRAISTGLPKSR